MRCARVGSVDGMSSAGHILLCVRDKVYTCLLPLLSCRLRPMQPPFAPPRRTARASPPPSLMPSPSVSGVQLCLSTDLCTAPPGARTLSHGTCNDGRKQGCVMETRSQAQCKRQSLSLMLTYLPAAPVNGFAGKTGGGPPPGCMGSNCGGGGGGGNDCFSKASDSTRDWHP